MAQGNFKRDFKQDVAAYLTASLLCLLTLFCVLQLWKADLRIPLKYWGDGLFFNMVVKGVMENGWYLHISRLGAPGSLEMYDFPMPDAVNLFIFKIFALFSHNSSLVLNVFYLLTYPSVTLAALYVLRKLQFSYPVAILLSLLYTFSPYHFFRGEEHLTLSTYYVIPLVSLLILRVCAGTAWLKREPTEAGPPRWNLQRGEVIGSVVICLLVGSTGWAYYPFLSCFLLMLAGVWAAVHHRHLRYVLVAAIFIAIISGSLLLNLLPNMIYFARHSSTHIAERNPGNVETYGLKIAQLVLPVTGHRVARLAAFKDFYNTNSPLVTENDYSTLGLVSSLGFLSTLLWIFYRRKTSRSNYEDNAPSLMDHLSVLNTGAILVGTIGGFSSLLAFLLFSQIRVYNRLSIFIAFFSLIAVGLGLEKIKTRLNNSRLHQALWYACLSLILVAGVFDQTTKNFVPEYEDIKTLYRSDADFMQRLEATLPPGSMIFQLPYIEFPEPQSPNKINFYEHFRGFLHSKTLRWSYGAMKGRGDDLWIRDVAGKPIDELVRILALAEFSGIYVDREGYEDHGAKIEAELAQLTAQPPLVSNNNRLAFYALTDFFSQLKNKYTPDQLAALRQNALHPVLVKWQKGFFDFEQNAAENWRWCTSEGELYLTNPSESPRHVQIEMTLASGYPDPSALRITGDAIQEELKINAAGQFYSRQWTVPPGGLSVKFASQAKRVDAPADPRFMVFKVMNFRMRNLD